MHYSYRIYIPRIPAFGSLQETRFLLRLSELGGISILFFPIYLLAPLLCNKSLLGDSARNSLPVPEEIPLARIPGRGAKLEKSIGLSWHFGEGSGMPAKMKIH